MRAGVLERTTVEALQGAGVGGRLEREGLVHGGLSLAFDGRRERVDLSELTGGGTVTVYGQTKVTQDLVAARLDAGADLRFEAEAIAIEGIDSDRPNAGSSTVRAVSRARRHGRLRRRMRRLPRDLPPKRAGPRREHVRKDLSVRVARHPFGDAADRRRAGLREP